MQRRKSLLLQIVSYICLCMVPASLFAQSPRSEAVQKWL